MNERLKQLMTEAGYAAPELAGRGQKLAELIVRECINTLEFHGFDDAIPCIKWMATNKLGQHFGVEE